MKRRAFTSAKQEAKKLIVFRINYFSTGVAVQAYSFKMQDKYTFVPSLLARFQTRIFLFEWTAQRTGTSRVVQKNARK